MPKAAPLKKAKQEEKPKKKNTGRPVRAAVQAARAAALKKLEEDERKQEATAAPQVASDVMSDSPQHVTVEVGDASLPESSIPREVPEEKGEDEAVSSAPSPEPEQTQSESIAAQNVAEAIATENPSEYAVVRRNVSSMRLFFAAMGTGVVLGLLIFGGIIFYQSRGGSMLLHFASAPSPTPTKAPSPTPTEVAVNPASYKVQVLNGTGASGAAGAAETMLNTAGFTDTTTGNSKDYGFTDTEVALKSGVSSIVFDKIKGALSEYNVVQVTSLPSSGSYDIVVTVGSSKASR